MEMYEFKYRMSDPQTGRFWQVDPLAEKYVYNSTYAFSENKVVAHIELEGLEAIPIDGMSIFKRAVAQQFLADAYAVDNTISKEREIKTSTPITSSTIRPVTVQTNLVTKTTTETTPNWGGFMNYMLYTNKVLGSNEPSTKTSTTETSQAVELKTTLNTKVGSGNASVSIDNKGNIIKEGGVAVNLKRIPFTVGGSASSSTDGKKEYNFQASPINTGVSIIGTYGVDWDKQSIGVGYSLEQKIGTTTVTTTEKIKIKL